jgi:flagellar motor component MotA
MILIANPIYDVVFKYLLEDTLIAKELLSTILGVNIIELTVKPQETIVNDETSGEVKIFRLDFKAVIKMSDGLHKTVLIELQKAKKTYDISRFRMYLGENYKRQETITLEDGTQEPTSLEIISIYILGFNLEGVEVPVLKVCRTYTDAITNEIVTANNEFISKLTHESYTIQVRRLKRAQRNKLEEVLEVFSQDNVTKNLHNIEIMDESKNPLVKKIVKRLSKAASDETIKRTMDAEDMIERLIDREAKEQLKEQAEEYEEKLREQAIQFEKEKAELKRQIEELQKKK